MRHRNPTVVLPEASRRMAVSRPEWLAELYRRLDASPAPGSADEAFGLVCRTLEEVEDALSGVSKASSPPPLGLDDGRMYPPQADRIVRDAGGRISAKTRFHRLICESDGRIEIINSLSGLTEFKK